MILFQKKLPYKVSTPPPYHIVRKKGWKNNFVDWEMMSFIVDTYCGEQYMMEGKKKKLNNLIEINKEERKLYKKKICQTCKEQILSEITR